MGTILKKWQRGFDLGDKFYNKVFENKILWALGFVALISFFVLEITEVILLRRAQACPLCAVTGFILLSAFNYFVSLVLFFYAQGLWRAGTSSLLESLKKSFFKIGTVIFWIALFLPLPVFIKNLLSAFIIPTIVFYRGDLREAAKYFFNLIKKYFVVVLGFGAYVLIIFLITMLLAGLFLWFMQMTKSNIWISVGLLVNFIVLFSVASFIRVMWTYLQVFVAQTDDQ
jgi:hypothetical protein